MRKSVRTSILLLMAGVIAILSAHPVTAQSVNARPSRPQIMKISAVKGSDKEKVNVVVSFSKAISPAKRPIILTEVKVGGRKCLAIKRSSKCIVKNVSIGKKVKIAARSRNRNGFGKWSTSVSFKPRIGAKWSRKSPAVKTPETAPDGGTNADTSLRFDFKGAVGLAIQRPSEIAATGTSVSKSNTSQRRSNLLGLTQNGALFDAVKSGTIQVKQFMIAPNDTIYLHADTTLVNGMGCVLLSVSTTSGIPDCVESDTTFVFQDGSLDFNGTRLPGNSLIQKFQFDSYGGIAYMGVSIPKVFTGSFGWGPGMGNELHYYRSGVKTVIRPTVPFPNTRYEDLKFPLRNFLLLGDGSLLVDEVDYPAEDFPEICYGCRAEYRLMRYYPDGRRNLISGFPSGYARTEPLTFMNLLPDGQIIVGTQYGWLEIEPGSDELKDRPYLSWSSTLTSGWPGTPRSPSGNLLRQSALFHPESFNCPVLNELAAQLLRTDSSGTGYIDDRYQSGATSEHIYLREICYALARHWRKTWFSNNQLIALTSRHARKRDVGENINGDLLDVDYQGVLVQAYPTFKPIITSITAVNVAQPVLNSVLLSGFDINGRNKTVLFDIDTKVETELISDLDDLLVGSLTFNAVDNSVYFGARRLSNNKSVIGRVSMETKRVSILQENTSNLLSIQMLNDRIR